MRATETNGSGGGITGAPQTGPVESGTAIVEGTAIALPVDAASGEPVEHEPPSLPPAGRLASAQIVPARTQIERMGQHRLHAIARDANGVRIHRPLSFAWHTDSGLLTLDPLDAAIAAATAGLATGRAIVQVRVSEQDDTATGAAHIDVVDELPNTAGPRPGIPEPTFVDEPTSEWRSRLRGTAWEVNSGHPDLVSAGTSARRKPPLPRRPPRQGDRAPLVSHAAARSRARKPGRRAVHYGATTRRRWSRQERFQGAVREEVNHRQGSLAENTGPHLFPARIL